MRAGSRLGAPDSDSELTPRDREQIAAAGIAASEVARQLAIFRDPPPATYVLRPCRPGDGIRVLSDAEKPRLAALARQAVAAGRVSRFVPASGAATRMFKELAAYLNEEGGGPGPEVETFFARLEELALAEPLREALGRPFASASRREILACLLTPEGLGYADLPKGLIPFHRYPEGPRTPFEEHLAEAAAGYRAADGLCRLCFTVPLQHQARFEALLRSAGPVLEARYGARLAVTFSHQEPATDTLAVDLDDHPFRQADGTLLFRPGGHGALLPNLAAWAREGGDLVLIKNIDNVVPDAGKPLVQEWKEFLLGLLVELEARAHGLLARLAAEGPDAALLAEAERFLRDELSHVLPDDTGEEERARLVADRLARPLRVSGVVPNTGEPGGGPFWVRSTDGLVSLQIVETSQIDPDSPEQRERLAAATHFNPVDLVCALRDRAGRPHDLDRHVDPATVFLSEKSHEGRPLKALEHPGLWNGAMAGWSTVFVEVPGATFAPVKTVLDLLRPEHQP
jgi:Domain of unknown function (DUF4301)